VIASLPGEPLLAETLASIAAQTLPAERVLVVCDAGDPLPVAWASEMSRILPVVEFHRNERPGQVAAINHGIALATTPYVAFLDADDLWQPEKQERQIALLQQEPELDAVTGLAANFRVDDRGQVSLEEPSPAIMFTAATFPRRTFERLGSLPPECTHFTWLYRWWGDARAAGIATRSIDYVGVHRRLHDANSWSVRNEEAHRDLLGELRRRVQRSRAQGSRGQA
jgi:glycosyltransferase involved in cell wall biosynthesis